MLLDLVTCNAAYALEDLLPSHVLQSRIQILDARSNVLKFGLVLTLNLVGLADDEVELELDPSVLIASAQPAAAARGRVRGEAELVVAGLMGREVEATGR